jgi:ABC-type transport system involved in multi-copper enzyme maturation permease subunit
VSVTTPTVPKLDAPGRVTFTRVMLSEWTKFRTVRSTKWSLAIAFLLTTAVPLIPAFIESSQPDQHGPNPLDIALGGSLIAQLAIAVLGVLVISAEYSTGSIRSTFSAVPQRLPVLWAKLVDYALVILVLMVPAVLLSFFVTQAILRNRPQLEVSFSAPGIARCLLLAPVYLMLVGVFALSLGAIIRSTAGSIASFAGAFFVLPPLAYVLLGSTWRDKVLPYLPSDAGQQMYTLHPDSKMLSPLGGGFVFAVWCAVAIAVAAVLTRRRDV